MSQRTKSGQKIHDLAVLRLAKQKQKEGYNVEADLPNWQKPPKINGAVPDVSATKGKEHKLFEVETEKTLELDKDQRSKFRDWSKKSRNRTFTTKTIKKK